MALPEIDQVKDAALKYDKRALAKMVQMGQLSPTIATMAAMMRDRIVQSEMKPPEQATVVEEVFQPAMPQGAGLAAVPTNPQMFQGMAGGGIVAMAGGGDVQRFQGMSGSFVEAARKLEPYVAPGTSFPTTTYGLRRLATIFPTTGKLFGVDEESLYIDPVTKRPVTLKEYMRLQEERGTTPPGATTKMPARLGGDELDAEAQAGYEAAAGARPSVKPPAGLPAAAAAAPRAPAPGIAGLDEYRKAEEERIKAMEKAVGKPSTIAEEAERQREINKAMGVDPDFFKNQARELVQQREELKGDRKEAANMRLLEAGLNILGGTSPYAFENIGKGASKALAGFADDLKDIKKQTRELEKARKEVLAAEQMAARSDSASVSARLDRSRDKVEAKEAALRDAKVEAKKTLVDLGLKSRQISATEMSARAQMKSAERPRSSGKAPDYTDIVKLAKEMVPAGQVWEGLTEEQRRALEAQAELKINLYAQGMGPSALSQILDPTFQAVLRRNLPGK